jgi:hypothetical protein
LAQAHQGDRFALVGREAHGAQFAGCAIKSPLAVGGLGCGLAFGFPPLRDGLGVFVVGGWLDASAGKLAGIRGQAGQGLKVKISVSVKLV